MYYGKTERGGATVAFDEEEYGAMRIIHPSKLPTMKTKNGRLLDDSKELFFEASAAVFEFKIFQRLF